jgi:hypothetical protein
MRSLVLAVCFNSPLRWVSSFTLSGGPLAIVPLRITV